MDWDLEWLPTPSWGLFWRIGLTLLTVLVGYQLHRRWAFYRIKKAARLKAQYGDAQKSKRNRGPNPPDKEPHAFYYYDASR